MLRQKPCMTLPCGKQFFGGKQGKFSEGMHKMIQLHKRTCKACQESDNVTLDQPVFQRTTKGYIERARQLEKNITVTRAADIVLG
jgi:hypothetical protein